MSGDVEPCGEVCDAVAMALRAVVKAAETVAASPSPEALAWLARCAAEGAQALIPTPYGVGAVLESRVAGWARTVPTVPGRYVVAEDARRVYVVDVAADGVVTATDVRRACPDAVGDFDAVSWLRLPEVPDGH